VHARTRLPTALTYAWLRRFHSPAKAVMVATAGVHDELARRGFANLVRWSRGVDTTLFRPGPTLRKRLDAAGVHVCRTESPSRRTSMLSLPSICPVRRSSSAMDRRRESLAKRHPAAVFTGAKVGAELAAPLSQR
jgi:hypothetical protein